MVLRKNEVLSIPLRVTTERGAPVLILYKKIREPEMIKNVVYAFLHDLPIVTNPICTNGKIAGTGTLIEKGVLYEEDNEYYFTF